MFTVEITHEFAAAHAIVIAGNREPVHGHNWHVTAQLTGPTLDDDGLLCDFHTVHGVLVAILEPFHNNDLNAIPPFDEINPTAELIAKHIADELSDRLGPTLAESARVESVRVTESPGCAAIYRP
ncbi:MAG: 6-carboxytetrahydropterin synthase [Planctomycetota bacterium]